MRVLFLSNYYPPFARGGYEQWCEEVAVEFARRGHVVRVITSHAPGVNGIVEDHGVQVSRSLRLEVEAGLAHTVRKLLRSRRRLERENLEQVQRSIMDFQPDAAFIWGMWNIPRSVPARVEGLLGERVAYYLCDYWPSLPSSYISQLRNPSDHALTRWSKQLISKPFLFHLEREPCSALRLKHPICVSRAVRDRLIQAGLAIAHAEVVYGGIRPEEFATAAAHRNGNGHGLNLLYAGRLTADKGVHTAIRAMALLAEPTDQTVTLAIVGKGDAVYEAELRALVAQQRLHERVTFKGAVARSEMPNIFAQYDALLFPSEWEEPFARTVLEAMASGRVVIGTTTGGTGEALVEAETGLTFVRGDADALARQIRRLRDDPALGVRLSAAGRQSVEQRFTLNHMVDQFEVVLQGIILNDQAKTRTGRLSRDTANSQPYAGQSQ